MIPRDSPDGNGGLSGTETERMRCDRLYASVLSGKGLAPPIRCHEINEIKWLTIFLAIGEGFGSASQRWFSGFAEPGHPPLGELLIHFPVI
jgi:hypothetical protein